MIIEVINIADNVAGSMLPGPTHPVAFAKQGGNLYQYTCLCPFPQVPGAVRCDTTWDGNGNPTVNVYKDAQGTTLATQTLTWTNGNRTSEVWT